MKLTIELVPKTCWFSNVRSQVTSQDWDTLRKECYKNANYICEICFGVGEKWPVECHEIWEYDDRKKIQKLMRLIALCPNCHKSKHIGFAKIQGNFEEIREHIKKVNGMTNKEIDKYIDKVFKVWQKRNNYNWKLDLSFLDNKNIKYNNRQQ